MGDLHGELDLLDHILRQLRFDPTEDVLWSIGDLIDRGPQSLEALQAFVGPTRRPGFNTLIGNHEAMLLASLIENEDLSSDAAYSARSLHAREGGEWTDAYRSVLAPLIGELRALPLCTVLSARDGRRVGLVHAEVSVRASWQDLEQARLLLLDLVDDKSELVAPRALWGRVRFDLAIDEIYGDPSEVLSVAVINERELARFTHGIDLVVAGHAILYARRPIRWGNHLWIDAGAFMRKHGGRLTVVDIDSHCFLQAWYDDPAVPASIVVSPLEPL